MFHYYYDHTGTIFGKITHGGPMQGSMPGDYVVSDQDLDPGQWQVNISTLELEPRE